MVKIILQRVVGVMALLVLAACSNGGKEMAELQSYSIEVMARPGGPIEPMPEFVSYETFTYSAAGMRGPFDIPLAIDASLANADLNQVQPDETREKEELEGFPLTSLKMVGSLSSANAMWVLLQDSSSEIHRVMVGNYVGRNHGKIVAANDEKIDIVEIVPNGSAGWIERPTTIVLDALEE